MNRSIFKGTKILTAVVIAVGLILPAGLMNAAENDEVKVMELPAPEKTGGKPLMEALQERSSSRSYSEKELSPQTISNLLWAAFGINRPESGKRTAPSARNRQEIDIYVAVADGLYLFHASKHALVKILDEDIRKVTGKQDFVEKAPLNLVYVADLSKMGDSSKEDKTLYAAADTGFIAQNVYLYCASEGLATVVRGWVDRPALAKAMKLKIDQKIILSQTVGHPGE